MIKMGHELHSMPPKVLNVVYFVNGHTTEKTNSNLVQIIGLTKLINSMKINI